MNVKVSTKCHVSLLLQAMTFVAFQWLMWSWCNLEYFEIVRIILDRLKVFSINLEEFGVWLFRMLIVKSCCLRLVLISIRFPILFCLRMWFVNLDLIQPSHILLVVRVIRHHEISVVTIFLATLFCTWKISYHMLSCNSWHLYFPSTKRK